MPYITQQDRDRLDDKENLSCNLYSVADIVVKESKLDGVLNYCITKMLLSIVKSKGESYSLYNTLIGVLECVKHELYRKQVSLYEDKKIKENGEIKL